MALFMFTKSIIENNPIQVFNNGNMERDFTYVDDIVEAIYRIIITDQTNRESYKFYNIGNSKPVKLLDFISEIEKKLNKQAIKELMPIQKGDVEKTFADVSALNEDYNFVPKTKISQGISNFIDWYQSYYTCEKE
jgi:UDP-glucuronate 4-epimerase